MEELNKQKLKELEALFRKQEPIHEMPFTDKWRIKWNNTRTTIKHLTNATINRLSMPLFLPRLVLPLVVILAFIFVPRANEANQTELSQVMEDSKSKDQAIAEYAYRGEKIDSGTWIALNP